MRRVLRVFLILTLLVPLASARAASLDDEKLPTDPALVTGRLPNGLRYIVRPHQNPQGRVSIWLHVASGSLNETDSTRGLAHYLEHMAFNGSTNFPPGSVVPFFQSLGLAFGRDQNAFTSFDQTTYQLALPGGGRDVVEKGMLFMSDVAMRLSLAPAAIDSERQVILEEKRARSSAQQRVQDQVYAQLAPESTVGRRLPIGTEPTIKSVAPADFHDYYTRWYVPSNMTVIVVGDTDPAMVVDVITKQFGGGPTVAAAHAARRRGEVARRAAGHRRDRPRADPGRGLDRAAGPAARAGDHGGPVAPRARGGDGHVGVRPPDERADRGGRILVPRGARVHPGLAGAPCA